MQNATTALSRRLLTLCLSAACAMAVSAVWTPVWSQAYPNKPVRIILPAGAGNPGDIRARQIAAAFPEVFGQQLPVEQNGDVLHRCHQSFRPLHRPRRR